MSKRSSSGLGRFISFILALLCAVAVIVLALSKLPSDFSFTDIVSYIRQDDVPVDDTDVEIADDEDTELNTYGDESDIDVLTDDQSTDEIDDIYVPQTDDTEISEEDLSESSDTAVDDTENTENIASETLPETDDIDSTDDISETDQTEVSDAVDNESTIHATAEYASVQTITISAAGDCTLGGDTVKGSYTRFKTYFENNGAAYFLENVKSIFENDDLTIVNLEGTFTDSDNRKDKTFSFKGDYKFSRILTEGSVELVSIDNNHSQDYYAQGVADTKKTLDYIGVGYAGLDVKYTTEIKGVKIGFLSYRIWDVTTDKLQSEVSEMKKECDLVIVAIHWGEEKVTKAGNDQIKLGHAAVDAGADLVLGHHPHVISSIEIYNGKYIVYSLGNFCFGGNQNPSDKDTFIFQVTYTMSDDGIIDTDVTIIPCTVSSVSNTNDYKPTPVPFEDGGLAILKRIANASKQFESVPDWNELAAKLSAAEE